MTYTYFETGSVLIDTINNTGDVLDVISPGYFDLNPDGSLMLTKHFDPYSIKLMKERNLKVVPFLGNHWDRDIGRAAIKNKKLLISQIANIINQYNLDGINVDIENLTEEDRDEFTLFVRELREAIPRNKEVSVAVAANPRGYTTGYYGSFDYAKLAQLADYLMVMSYSDKTKSLFKDIDQSQWSYPFVLAMSESKIFEGYEDGTFRPKEKVTREQMAALLERIKDRI